VTAVGKGGTTAVGRRWASAERLDPNPVHILSAQSTKHGRPTVDASLLVPKPMYGVIRTVAPYCVDTVAGFRLILLNPAAASCLAKLRKKSFPSCSRQKGPLIYLGS